MTYASRTGTFTTVNGTIGGGLAFNPTYNATNLTLTVGQSPAPGLEANGQTEVPPLTNDVMVNDGDVEPVTNAFADNPGDPLSGLSLDVEQSAALTKQTGKEWLFYTME